jgi:HSP20 family protein
MVNPRDHDTKGSGPLDAKSTALTFFADSAAKAQPRKEQEGMALMRFSPEMDPVGALLALQRGLSRTLESPVGVDFGPSGRGVYPAINVFGDRDGYVLRMEVPGVSPDSLQIESRGQTLVISGKRDLRTSEEGSFHRRERSYGEFARSMQLPADVDASRTEATYKNGMLTLRVPKREDAKARQIAVKSF